MDTLSPPRWAIGEQFEDTSEKVRLRSGEERPVLRLGNRFYAGETLSLVNPNGFGGQVWSGSTIELLQGSIYGISG